MLRVCIQTDWNLRLLTRPHLTEVLFWAENWTFNWKAWDNKNGGQVKKRKIVTFRKMFLRTKLENVQLWKGKSRGFRFWVNVWDFWNNVEWEIDCDTPLWNIGVNFTKDCVDFWSACLSCGSCISVIPWYADADKQRKCQACYQSFLVCWEFF